VSGRLYESLLPQVQEILVQEGVPVPGWRAAREERERFAARVAQAIVERRLPRDGWQVAELAGRLASMMMGTGLLEPLQEEPGIEEVIVRNGHVQVERYGQIEDVGDVASNDYFRQVALRVADLGGQVMKADRPFVLVDLPNGSRFTAMVEPLSVNGVAINIRVFRPERQRFSQIVSTGTFEPYDPARDLSLVQPVDDPGLPPLARFLASLARSNLASAIVSGPFSSGKTTLLNAMSQYFPTTLQLSVVETFRELQLAHPYAARAVVPATEESGQVTMREVVNVLYTRMRPDALVVGEVVADEAREFLRAANLGVRAYTTIHGETPLDALRRLETLAQEEDVPLMAVRELVGRGVQLVLQMRRDSLGRRFLAQVAQVQGCEGGNYVLKVLYDAGAREGQKIVEELWRACLPS